MRYRRLPLLDDIAQEALDEAFDRAVHFLVNPPMDKAAAERAFGELVGILYRARYPEECTDLSRQAEMFNALLERYQPNNEPLADEQA